MQTRGDQGAPGLEDGVPQRGVRLARRVEQRPGLRQFLALHGHCGEDQPFHAGGGGPGQPGPFRLRERLARRAFGAARPAVEHVEEGEPRQRVLAWQGRDRLAASGRRRPGQRGPRPREVPGPQPGGPQVVPQQREELRVPVEEFDGKEAAQRLGLPYGVLRAAGRALPAGR